MRDGCKEIDLGSSTPGQYYVVHDNDCIFQSNTNYLSYDNYVYNITNLTFDLKEGATTTRYIYLCRYDHNFNFIDRIQYPTTQFEPTGNNLELSTNYFYKVSYSRNNFKNFKAYQCNASIGTMANELAFGKLTFLDQIGTIIPFVITLIAFALGFLLLKKMIKRGSHGHA